MVPPGSPCSRSPWVRTMRSWPSAVRRTTWNQPSASDTYSSDPSASQRAPVSWLSAPGDDLSVTAGASTMAICDVSGRGLPRGHDRQPVAVRRPGEPPTSMPAAVSGVGRGGFGSFAGRPRRGTGASISQTCVQPRRRDRNARRWPSGDQRG